jgi:serralysin
MAVSQTDQFDKRVLDLINQERAKLKLKPLSLSEKLDTAADLHSKDMALKDYFSHTGKDGSSPGTRIKRAGYTQGTTWGENIAAGQTTPESVVQAWMNSSGHRANILNPKFTHMGLGYTFLANDTGRVNYRHYWTQVFAAGDPNPGQYVTSSNSLQTSSFELSPPLSAIMEGSGNGKVSGEVEDALLSGGKGNEILVGNGGTDTITDFQNELDQIGSASGLTFGPITLNQSGTDTLSNLAKGTEILIVPTE